jgi:hypothetical protein
MRAPTLSHQHEGLRHHHHPMTVSTNPDQRHALVRGQLPATGVDQDTYNGRYVPSTRLDPILPMPATPSMFTFLRMLMSMATQ